MTCTYQEQLLQAADFTRAQTWHKPADVAEALERSLNNLQLDYGAGNYIGLRFVCKLPVLIDADQLIYTLCIVNAPLCTVETISIINHLHSSTCVRFGAVQ